MFRSTAGYVMTQLFSIVFFVNLICARPLSSFQHEDRSLMRRVEPYFPDSPPSCPICAQNYGSISSCAQASVVLANFSMVVFNPGAFVDVIKCACTDTFQAAFPQCVDCFVQTNQTDVLNTPNLPDLVSNIRSVCAFASTVLSNKTKTSSVAGPMQTSSATAKDHIGASMIAGGTVLLAAFSSFL